MRGGEPCALQRIDECQSGRAGGAFADMALVATAPRVMDCEEVEPAVLQQAQGEVYSTYERLRAFLMDEAERLAPGRITYHGLHSVMVRTARAV